MVTQTLTAKQHGFVDSTLQGKNPSQAYRLNYDASNMSPQVVSVEAARLLAHPKISLAITEARQRNRDWTLATVLQDCDENLRGAREDHQWSAANAIVTTGAKVAGILTDKVDINVTHTLKPGLSLEELEARVARLDALEFGVIEGTMVDAGESDVGG